MINPRYQIPWSKWWHQFYAYEYRHELETQYDDADRCFFMLVKKTIGDRWMDRNELFCPEEWEQEADPPTFWVEPAGDPDVRGKTEINEYRDMILKMYQEETE